MRTKIWLLDIHPSNSFLLENNLKKRGKKPQWISQKEEATVCTIIQQDAVGNPPVKRTQQRYVQLQERLHNWNISNHNDIMLNI
jgi:hypothetical protein